MATDGWAHAHKVVMAKAADGFLLSELKGVYKKCAERLIDQGKLQSFLTAHGDRWVGR